MLIVMGDYARQFPSSVLAALEPNARPDRAFLITGRPIPVSPPPVSCAGCGRPHIAKGRALVQSHGLRSADSDASRRPQLAELLRLPPRPSPPQAGRGRGS